VGFSFGFQVVITPMQVMNNAIQKNRVVLWTSVKTLATVGIATKMVTTMNKARENVRSIGIILWAFLACSS
jgi:hypothetical protein